MPAMEPQPQRTGRRLRRIAAACAVLLTVVTIAGSCSVFRAPMIPEPDSKPRYSDLVPPRTATNPLSVPTVMTGRPTEESVTTEPETSETDEPTTESSEPLPDWSKNFTVDTALLILKSQGCFVIDERDEQVAFWYEPEEEILPASVTKLLSVLYASTLIEPDEVIEAGSEVKLIAPTSSVAFVGKGMRLTMQMLVEGMLLASGNDAAYALAAAGGRRLRGVEDLSDPSGRDETTTAEDIDRFVEGMQAFAEANGMEGSVWLTPDGFRAEGQFATLSDLARLGFLAGESPLILQTTKKSSQFVLYVSGESMTWENGNALVQQGSSYYRPEVVGLKTGSFSDYNNVLILTDDGAGNGRLIGVFGMENSAERFDLAARLVDETAESLSRGTETASTAESLEDAEPEPLTSEETTEAP